MNLQAHYELRIQRRLLRDSIAVIKPLRVIERRSLAGSQSTRIVASR